MIKIPEFDAGIFADTEHAGPSPDARIDLPNSGAMQFMVTHIGAGSSHRPLPEAQLVWVGAPYFGERILVPTGCTCKATYPIFPESLPEEWRAAVIRAGQRHPNVCNCFGYIIE